MKALIVLALVLNGGQFVFVVCERWTSRHERRRAKAAYWSTAVEPRRWWQVW